MSDTPAFAAAAPAAPAPETLRDHPSPSGLGSVDEVMKVGIGGANVTVTRGELERAANHSNCVWRLRAEKQITDLEHQVETLKTQLAQLIGYTHTHQMAVEHLLKTAPPQTPETGATETEGTEAPETT
jgi:hypothetical protein